VVIPLPHQTLTDYHRDFRAGILEKFCPSNCHTCGAPIDRFEYRLRKAQQLWVLRGRCRGACVHCFTFLPLFVAPGKWYPYAAIEEALGFVSQGRFANPTAALKAWEANRETRVDQRQVGGPSETTVRRWRKELDQDQPERPWAERAAAASLLVPGQVWPGPACQCGPDGLPGEKTPPPIPANIALPSSPPLLEPGLGLSFTAVFLGALRMLGEALLGSPSSPPPGSCLAMGMWFLEGRFQQRCLAGFELVGNVVPGLIPDLAATQRLPRGYPPQPPPPS